MSVFTMKQLSLPTFAELSKALDQTELKLHASQAHGLIAGILCGIPAKRDAAWRTIMSGSEEGPETTHAMLQGIYQATNQQLADNLFEFQLLLPSDAEALPVCAEALTLWCQGFLTGLKMVEVSLTGSKDSEVTEVISDIVEIAKMNYEEVVASEEDEAAYVELVEYVRMAVILIYQDMREQEEAKKAPGHLH